MSLDSKSLHTLGDGMLIKVEVLCIQTRPKCLRGALDSTDAEALDGLRTLLVHVSSQLPFAISIAAFGANDLE